MGTRTSLKNVTVANDVTPHESPRNTHPSHSLYYYTDSILQWRQRITNSTEDPRMFLSQGVIWKVTGVAWHA